MKRTPLRRQGQRRSQTVDPVTPDVADEVMTRDGGCVAPRLGATDPCRGPLHRDHVKDRLKVGDPIVKRRTTRAPSDRRHLVIVCAHHHLDGWATAHRDDLRDYIDDKERGRAT